MNEIHVVAAVIENAQGKVLLAQRPSGRDHAGMWEFPGGKVEAGESAQRALCRELREELAIKVAEDDLQPLIRVRHSYPHQTVDLDVWRVGHYHGEAHGREQQSLRWELPTAMAELAMPEADRPVVTALRLPEHYAISPEPDPDSERFLDQLDRTLAAGCRLIQLRAPLSDPETLPDLAREFGRRCRVAGAQWLINADWALAEELGADGVHLPARFLWVLQQRPVAAHHWLAVSCHDAEELAMAEALGADFVTLSPVLATASHPDAEPLGWEAFARLRRQTRLPVFALGGLDGSDQVLARSHGAHGVAGISSFWQSS